MPITSKTRAFGERDVQKLITPAQEAVVRFPLQRCASAHAILQGRAKPSYALSIRRAVERFEDPISFAAIEDAFVLTNCGHSYDRNIVPTLLDVPAAQRKCPLCATPITAPPKRNALAQSLLDVWHVPPTSPVIEPEWSKDEASLGRWLAGEEERRRISTQSRPPHAVLRLQPGARPDPAVATITDALLGAGLVAIAIAVASVERKGLYHKVAYGVVGGCIVGAMPRPNLVKPLLVSLFLLGPVRIYLTSINNKGFEARIQDVQFIYSGAFVVQYVLGLLFIKHEARVLQAPHGHDER